MFTKLNSAAAFRLAVLGLAVAAAQVASGYELIEMNDQNQNAMDMDTLRAVKTIQQAVLSEFQFASVHEAIEFIGWCQDLRRTMSKSSDSDFRGLAVRIKALLEIPPVKANCNVDKSKLEPFVALDRDYGDEFAYLSPARTSKLMELGARLEAEPEAKALVGRTFETLKRGLAESLLKGAVLDTIIMFNEIEERGFLKMDKYNKRGCELSDVEPICKLARRTSTDAVSAIGHDFFDLSQLIEAKDEEKLAKHQQLSGVGLAELEKRCKSISGSMRPFAQLNSFVEAHFLQPEQVAAASSANKDFDFFLQLYNLCSRYY